MTWGDRPYKNVASLDVLLQLIQDDYRLARPEHCPHELYQIMSDCWAYEVGLVTDEMIILSTFSSRLPVLL